MSIEPDKKRFFKKVKKESNDCWIWTGSTGGGYPQFFLNGKLRSAKHVIWEWTHGNLNGHLSNICNNRLCVNPKHMILINKMVIKPAQTREKQFWNQVNQDGDCWLWTGTVRKDGNVKIKIDGREWMAHRFAWEEINGPLDRNQIVRHTCGNKHCMNPDHMFIGKYGDNRKGTKENKSTKQQTKSNFFDKTHDKYTEIINKSQIEKASKEKIEQGFNFEIVDPPQKKDPVKMQPTMLNEKKIKDANERVIGGESIAVVAKDLGVPEETLNDALKGRTWVHLNLPKLLSNAPKARIIVETILDSCEKCAFTAKYIVDAYNTSEERMQDGNDDSITVCTKKWRRVRHDENQFTIPSFCPYLIRNVDV